MFQYALIADNGEVQHVVSTGTDADYTDGDVYNGLTAVQISSDLDAQNLIETKYYIAGEWLTREARPNPWSDWVNNEWNFNTDRFLLSLRFERNNNLSATDWTQLPDSPITEEKKLEWLVYREALRDVPETYAAATSLDEIIWPTKPE